MYLLLKKSEEIYSNPNFYKKIRLVKLFNIKLFKLLKDLVLDRYTCFWKEFIRFTLNSTHLTMIGAFDISSFVFIMKLIKDREAF